MNKKISSLAGIAILVVVAAIVALVLVYQSWTPKPVAENSPTPTPAQSGTPVVIITPKPTPTVMVTPFSNSSITVLSPNGGETLIKETLANIKWQDSTPACVREDCISNSYDVNLITLNSPSLVYNIAFNITGQGCIGAKCFGGWGVGRFYLETGGISSVPNGKYLIQVCIRKELIIGDCDQSDNFFWIAQ